MKIPLHISARNIALTETIEAEIQKNAAKLDRFYDSVVSCRVVIEPPHKHKHKGMPYDVKITIIVPGAELAVTKIENSDLYTAIRQAFDAARRQVEDYARKQRGDVKSREESPAGKIHSLFFDEGYGFITTQDGREIYFHKNSLLDVDFKKVQPGMKVRFTEVVGEKGPQASTVSVAGA